MTMPTEKLVGQTVSLRCDMCILKNAWRCVLPAGMGAGDSKLRGSSCGYSDRGGGS
jgi:hypothetical protein